MSQQLPVTQASSDSASAHGNLQSIGSNNQNPLAVTNTASVIQNQILSQPSQYSSQSVKTSQMQSSVSGTCNEFPQVISFILFSLFACALKTYLFPRCGF